MPQATSPRSSVDSQFACVSTLVNQRLPLHAPACRLRRQLPPPPLVEQLRPSARAPSDVLSIPPRPLANTLRQDFPHSHALGERGRNAAEAAKCHLVSCTDVA